MAFVTPWILSSHHRKHYSQDRSVCRASLSNVHIFDTTLRDGLAAFSKPLAPSKQLEVAHLLAKAGVHIIEAGYPAVIPESFQVVRQIATLIGNEPNPPTICTLARLREHDIDLAVDAVRTAARPRVNVFASAGVRREKQKQVLEEVAKGVRYACGKCGDVQFTVANAVTSDMEFVREMCKVANWNGAGVICLADSAGRADVEDVVMVVQGVKGVVQGVLGVHMHDFKGRAVENSMKAVEMGVVQVECTVDGFGDGGGNTSVQKVYQKAGLEEKNEFSVISNILKEELQHSPLYPK